MVNPHLAINIHLKSEGKEEKIGLVGWVLEGR
jgi:hypothetical protein